MLSRLLVSGGKPLPWGMLCDLVFPPSFSSPKYSYPWAPHPPHPRPLCVCVCARVCVFLIVAVLSLRCCTRAFSSCRARRLLSGRGAQAAHRGGFPCCGGQALGSAGSVLQLWRTGFVAPRQVGSSQTQDRTLAPAAPALPGRFLTKGLPGKSLFSLLWLEITKRDLLMGNRC